YRFADAGALAPFTYTAMIWSLLLGWLWFADTPTLPMLAGAAVVMGAGFLIVWRERQLGLTKTAGRKVGAKGMQ
ncbi:MAG: EamA/RhaT family transporter, partial [Pseudomonadota bacterium]